MRGTVKFYQVDRGFGFVTGEDGRDYHFNKASLPRQRRYDPVEGDTVEFETRDVPKGSMAFRINLSPSENDTTSAIDEKDSYDALHDLQILRNPA
jgi:CspA family cold shock protein